MSDVPEYRKLNEALAIISNVVNKLGTCLCAGDDQCNKCQLWEAEDIIDQALTFLPPEKTEHVSRLLLCEPAHLILKPNQFYYFTVAIDCSGCLEAAAHYTGEVSTPTPHEGKLDHDQIS